MTKTTGRRAASRSSSARTAHRNSSGVDSPPNSPIACPTWSTIASASALIAGQRGELAAGFLRWICLLKIRGVDQRLGERVERDPLAVRQAAAAQDRGVRGELVRERRHQPGLADPGDAEHREELARLVRHRSAEHVAQERELPLPSDDRRIEVSREPGRSRHHLDQAVGRHGLGLPFHRQVFDRSGDDRVANERERAFAEQDLAGGRGLLEARRDVHGVAGHDLLVAHPGDDVAGVHPDPAGERHPVVAFEIRVQPLERRAHLARSANRAQRVVLVDLRDAEDGHDGVADVLLDGAPMMFDRRPHRLEVPLHDAAYRLRVERLAHRGGADHVAEDDRDRLADLVRRRLRGQRRRAVLTELRLVAVLMSARFASQHVGRLERRKRVAKPDPARFGVVGRGSS